MRTERTTRAWLVVWQCSCSDVRIEKADLPERCLGHGSAPIENPELIDCLTEWVDVHECDHVTCVEVVR